METSYYGWADDSGRKSVDTKVNEGAAIFEYRWQKAPEFVMMNATDLALYHGGLKAIEAKHIRPNYFWFGPVEVK